MTSTISERWKTKLEGTSSVSRADCVKTQVRFAGLWLVLAAGYALVANAAEPFCPLIPFGAITGKPSEQTVKETLEAYRSVGVDQYMIYARSGLEFEYMGEEWLRMCEQFCKHAKRLNMKIWLYDEYNWPSGSCKGRVPAENPDYESRQYAVYSRADGTFDWQVVHSPGWVDNYNFKAMSRFVELTHEQYEKRLGPYLGSTVVGIFTDEPAHPTPVHLERKPALLFRYFDGAEAEYEAATGRALRADVQAYLTDPAKDGVWGIYYNLLGERFRKAYFDPIRAWCDRVGILATGHMIAENSTCDSALYNGRPLLALKGLTVPGMDEIGTRLEPRQIEWLTFAVAQHAIGRRGNGGMAELFACGPCDMMLATKRQMLWLCALHKIDRYCLGIAPLDARGNLEKNGYFNSCSPTQPWFPALRLLGDEARLAARFAAKPAQCDIAIRYPQTASAKLAMRKKSHPLLVPALRCFSEHQLTYDLCDEGEACDKPLVFAFDGEGLREEKSGRLFAKPEEAAVFAAAVCPPAVRVETPEGKLADTVLVRSYGDGDLVVLALGSKEPGLLRLMRRGFEPESFSLPARGVFIRERNQEEHASSRAEPISNATTPKQNVNLSLSDPTAFRLVFDSNGISRLKVAQSIDGVRFVMRCWPEPQVLKLDGKQVPVEAPCDTLRQGFNELCRQTAPFRLEAGDHEVMLSPGGADNIYYFPMAWLTGMFSVENRVVKPVPRDAGLGALWRMGLADYSGRVTFTVRTEVPRVEGELRLRLDTGGLYTAVSLDGKSLGERAWAPFEWTVPGEMKGKSVDLSIAVSTSAAPLFGDVNAPGSIWSKKFWTQPPLTRAEIGLLRAPEWLSCKSGSDGSTKGKRG